MTEALDPAIGAAVRASFARQALMAAIGARLERVAYGEVDVALPYRADLTQQNGFLHAAAVTAILDSAAGYAALTAMPAGSEVLSVEFKVNLLAPAVGETFVAKARVKRAGRTITVCEAECVTGGGKVCAMLVGTFIRQDARAT